MKYKDKKHNFTPELRFHDNEDLEVNWKPKQLGGYYPTDQFIAKVEYILHKNIY